MCGIAWGNKELSGDEAFDRKFSASSMTAGDASAFITSPERRRFVSEVFQVGCESLSIRDEVITVCWDSSTNVTAKIIARFPDLLRETGLS